MCLCVVVEVFPKLNGAGNWLMSFNTAKTKLVKFHLHEADPKPAPILISGHTLRGFSALTTGAKTLTIGAKTHSTPQTEWIKTLEKLSIHYRAPEIIELSLL